jgi:hypothetical protein
MKTFSKLMVMALAVLPFSGTLAAQDAKRFDASLSWSLATDNLKEITNASGAFAGFNASFGYTGKLAATTVPLRLSLGINDFPGKDRDGVKQSLLGVQAAADIFIDTGVRDLSLVTGVSLNKWTKDISPKPDGYSSDVKGIKFGARLGLNYRLNPSWSMHTLLQVVEVGTDPMATKGWNASWVEIGAAYHF